jgi:hypothetical protein
MQTLHVCKTNSEQYQRQCMALFFVHSAMCSKQVGESFASKNAVLPVGWMRSQNRHLVFHRVTYIPPKWSSFFSKNPNAFLD